jgi:hypothetical protein
MTVDLYRKRPGDPLVAFYAVWVRKQFRVVAYVQRRACKFEGR